MIARFKKKSYKWSLPAIILLAVLGCVVLTNAEGTSTTQNQDPKVLGKEFVELVVKGQFSTATKNFNATMKKVLPPEKLEETWKSTTNQAGLFKQQIGIRMGKWLWSDIVYVSCEFEQGPLDVKVVYNSQKQVTGLWFVPTPEDIWKDYQNQQQKKRTDTQKTSQTLAESDINAKVSQNPTGKWQSVDFIQRAEDFKPGVKLFKGELFLKDAMFMAGGRTSISYTWTKDWIWHSDGKTKAQYKIKQINGQTYLFLPWLSRDVTMRGQKPWYYVLKKISGKDTTNNKTGHKTQEQTTKTTVGSGSFQRIRPIKSVNEFDDVRWKDMSKLDLSARKRLITTLNFNQKTVWPEPTKMPPGRDPNKILTDAMNPGLGVRALHQQGFTGKGVNVAIIDQPLYQDHPEFAGKIVAYHDTGCGSQSSMHGPAVASLLVGTNCGTAPGTRVYYAAAPSWKRDAAYYAKGLDWIIAQNEKLPKGEKIRVVSVSAAPSGPGSPFDKHNEMWDRACARAEADGIMVLDCTDSHRGFIGRCWYNARAPESVNQCNPWAPPNRKFRFNPNDIGILVPSSPRTTAEEHDKGDCSYQYCGRGGLSWAIPYCAGVLAMGWQVNPELTPDQMRELLFKSALTKKNGAKIINPKKFIRLVRMAKAAPKTK